MYCPQCGGVNDESARFCMTCGIDMDPYRRRAQELQTAASTPHELDSVSQQPTCHLAEAPSGGAPETPAVEIPRAAGGLTAGIVPSGLVTTGYDLLSLAFVGIVLLWLAQMVAAYSWLSGFDRMLGEQVFMATRGTEARTIGLIGVGLAAVTVILTSGLTLFPRSGIGFRMAGYTLMWVGVMAALVALWQGWVGGNIAYVLLPVGLVVVAGSVLVMKGTKSFRELCKARLGVNKLYRKSGLGVRLGIIGALWALATIGYITVLAADSSWTVRAGGYIGGALLAVGLMGAVAMLAGLRRRPLVWIDAEGRLTERDTSVPTVR